ncbi:asparagine synthase (glutamine-hydrolyzing) [bacterium]|nr:asparagine synthase (glutamine-hydrolyzing) [bacterium]
MCGILGTIPKTEEHFFKSSLDTLAHRGPDEFGIWSTDDISLGHRRLSILDLSPAGHQPMSYANGRYEIVFNGEIYNFLEIRDVLIAKGHRFRSSGDTEVVLAAYAEWGKDCLLKFNGMWSMAIWDNTDKILFLTRDRFGKKPLFYAFVKDKFIFASEMKAIYAFLPEVKPSKDFHWMANNIFNYEGTDKCLVEGIKRFPAGHFGYYKNGNLSLSRYWNTLDHLVTPPTDYKSQIEEFRELFIDACKIRMRSDVPIGTALSGGLDSSATISVMAHIAKSSPNNRVSHDWQHAFVASFPGTTLDETYYAKKVVNHLGIGGTYINIEPLKVWDKIYDYFYLFEDLYITSPIPMIMTYKAIKEHGVTVSIDGHGADELFSGYGHIEEALFDARLSTKKIFNILETLRQSELSDKYQFNNNNLFTRYIKSLTKITGRKIIKNKYRSIDYKHCKYHKLDNFTKSLYLIFHNTILPTLLRNYDRYSMINGVEIRMPFMDHRIVSYIFSLPFSSKFNNGFTKALVRDALNSYLPHEVAYRKTKIGFNAPIVDWMQGPLKEFFEDTVNSQDFLMCNLLSNAISIKKNVLDITSKKISLFSSAEQTWTKMQPYFWINSLILHKVSPEEHHP